MLFTSMAHAKEELTIYTVNYPLQYFAQRIAGNLARVFFPIPANQDPAFWTPSPEIIGNFQRADLILLNGADYAKWVNYSSLPHLKTVNTSSSFSSSYIKTGNSATHSHGPKGEHSHDGTAFTTWLDFRLALQQAESIKNALIKRLPSDRDEIDKNFISLKKDLLKLDHELGKITSNKPGLALIASHPVYQYLARRYQIDLQSVLWEPGVFPANSEWKNLEQKLILHPVRWMVWEGRPLPETKVKLESLGLKSMVFEPCSNQPLTGDFLTVMNENIKNLSRAYTAEKGESTKKNADEISVGFHP